MLSEALTLAPRGAAVRRAHVEAPTVVAHTSSSSTSTRRASRSAYQRREAASTPGGWASAGIAHTLLTSYITSCYTASCLRLQENWHPSLLTNRATHGESPLTTKPPDTARFEEAVQQYNRAARLETLARTEVTRAASDPMVQLQHRVLQRTAAATREAARCARQAHDAGLDAEVVNLAAATALGCADAAQDALEVLRRLLKQLDPAFEPTAAPPARSTTAPDRQGPMTRETRGGIDAAIAQHKHRGMTAESALEVTEKERRDHDTQEDPPRIFPEA